MSEEKQLPKYKEVRIERGKIGDMYVEAIEDGFLVNDGGSVWYKPYAITDDIEKICYLPETELPYPPYKLEIEETASSPFLKLPKVPNATVPQPSMGQLVQDVYGVWNDFLDVEKEYKELLTIATFLSYQQEKVKSVPYIFFIGEKGTGKSRALEIAEWLMYRPLNATSITAANVFYYLEDGPKVILDDEAAYSINKDPDKRAIYLKGNRNGAKIIRIVEDSKGRKKKKYFNAYSLKMFASKEAVRNDQFLDRCIMVKTVKGNPRFGGFIDSDEILFHRIRTKLLIWRLYTLNEKLYYPIYERPKNRIDEIFNPLLAIARLLEFGEKNIEKVRDSETIERLNELKSSLEYKVALATITLMVSQGSYTIRFNDIFNTAASLVNGVEVKGKIVCPEYGEITKTRIGRICSNILGGKRHIMWIKGTTVAYYTWTPERYIENYKQYQITKEDIENAKTAIK